MVDAACSMQGSTVLPPCLFCICSMRPGHHRWQPVPPAVQMYMSQQEVVDALQERARIEPAFTQLVGHGQAGLSCAFSSMMCTFDAEATDYRVLDHSA